MRFLAGVIVMLLALWSGYWLIGQRMIEARIGAILAADLPQGVVLTQTGFDVAGFPNRFDLTVSNPDLTDAATGWGWQAEFAQVFAMTWKPWHLIAALPDAQRLQTPFGALDLTSTRFMASLQVVPNADLPLEEAVLDVREGVLSSAMFQKIGAQKLVVALKRDAGPGFAYRLGVQVEGLSALVAGAEPMETARLDTVLMTTAALDRNAGQTRPELTGIDLAALSMTRGAVTINGAGHILTAADGFAEGLVDFKVGGWRGLPVMLADFGMIRPEIAATYGKALEIIAAEQGNPEVLSLPLSFRAGRSYLGPLPIGRAPMLVQRQ